MSYILKNLFQITLSIFFFSSCSKAPEEKIVEKEIEKAPKIAKHTYYDGLFVLAGLGARGLSTSAMLASYLAKMLIDGFSTLAEQHVSSVHPSRFIIRELKRH